MSSIVSAIEIYNKPNFLYREESFSILAINAWELLLKAKILKEASNKLSSIYAKEHRTNVDGSKSEKKYVKKNRAGNPGTVGLYKAMARLSEEYSVNLDSSCGENIDLLVEIRDNAVHFKNDDKLLSKKVQEIGTANLKNYLALIKMWFSYDLSEYNFYLMPLSFFHDFDSADAIQMSKSTAESKALLLYISEKEKEHSTAPTSQFNLTLKLKTKFIKSSDTDALLVKYSEEPNAVAVTIKEESVRENYPWDYQELTRRLRGRYQDFKQNRQYNLIMRGLKTNKKLCNVRHLDPGNPKSAKKEFYNPNILKELDKHYNKGDIA